MTLLFYVICWPALWRGPFLLTWHLPVIVWLSSQRWQWRRWWGSLCICRRRRKRRNVQVIKRTRKRDYVFLRGDTLMSLRPVHPIRLLLLFLCSFFLFPLAFSTRAFAAADPISVTSESDVIQFPSSIDFTMTAKDTASPIVQATIYIIYKEPPYSFAKEHSITLITPARSVTVHWHEDTSGDNFDTPATPVEYKWML